MTEDKELKRRVMEILKGFVQDKSYAKYFKKHQCICDCVKQASEDDLEIVKRLDGEVQDITSLQFQADRYYRRVFKDGAFGDVRKQNPVRITTKDIAFFGKIYNVKKENLTAMEDFLYDIVLNKNESFSAKEVCYSDKVYVIYNGNIMYNYYLPNDLKEAYEKAYRAANETSLYNYPEEQTRLDLSSWMIVDEAKFTMIVYPILLKIKDKEGKEVKMYVGNYNLLTDNIDVSFTCVCHPILFTTKGERRELRKTLFKWVW